MIWYSKQTALFLFLLAKAAATFLPTALSMAPRPLFPFQQAQFVQVFPLKPAPFYTLFAGLGSTNKSAIFFLFSSSSTLVLSSPPCLLLQFFWQEPSFLSVLSNYNGSPDLHFFLETARLMSWPDGEGCLCRLQSLVVSLISRIHPSLFSDWRRTVSSKFFVPQVPSISIEECIALARLCCNGHSLLLNSYSISLRLAESSIFPAAPADTSHLILHYPATDSLRRSLFGDSLSLRLLVKAPGELPGFWGSIVFRYTPIPWKRSGNQQQQVPA